jgi:hypothetical protein
MNIPTTNGDPAPVFAAIAIDCTDPAGLAEFWAALVGSAVEPDPEGDASVRFPSGVTLDFVRVPEAKSVKNRLHIDVRAVGDFAAAVERAVALGATRADDIYAGGSWQVLRDPEGNEFCILRPRG